MTIVSHQHGYLFIKTRKVAGTSVEAVLRSCTGPEDIVTPLTPRDERYCADLGLDARNYAPSRDGETGYRKLVMSGEFSAALAWHGRLKKRYGPHMSAATLSRRLGRRTFSNLYRFSIERNPFSWLVSMVTHDTRAYNAGASRVLDAEAIRRRIQRWLSGHRGMDGSNYNYYTIRGKLAVDGLLRYEDLAADLADLLRQLDVEPTLSLPRLKASPGTPSLEEIYTPVLEAEVVARYDPVFELMGYPRRVADADTVSGAPARRSTDRPTSPPSEARADRPRTSDRAQPEPG